MGENDVKLSEYNDASLSILRLHETWIAIENFANSGNLYGWKYKLDSVWRELYVDVLRNPKKEEVIKKNNTLMNSISKAKTRATLYFALHKRHEFLREVQDLAGKAGKYSDEDGL
jgi:hypothetical protein